MRHKPDPHRAAADKQAVRVSRKLAAIVQPPPRNKLTGRFVDNPQAIPDPKAAA